MEDSRLSGLAGGGEWTVPRLSLQKIQHVSNQVELTRYFTLPESCAERSGQALPLFNGTVVRDGNHRASPWLSQHSPFQRYCKSSGSGEKGSAKGVFRISCSSHRLILEIIEGHTQSCWPFLGHRRPRPLPCYISI